MLSPRLMEIVDALPLRPGMRVLEIGCGSGAMAREIARRIGRGYVLGIDRSATAITKAKSLELAGARTALLRFRRVAAEAFTLAPDELPFDLAVAVRVGAFDGRRPALGRIAIPRIRGVHRTAAPFLIDGGAPLREVPR